MGEWGKKQFSRTGCPVVLVACKVHYDCMLTRTALVALGCPSMCLVGILTYAFYIICIFILAVREYAL